MLRIRGVGFVVVGLAVLAAGGVSGAQVARACGLGRPSAEELDSLRLSTMRTGDVLLSRGAYRDASRVLSEFDVSERRRDDTPQHQAVRTRGKRLLARSWMLAAARSAMDAEKRGDPISEAVAGDFDDALRQLAQLLAHNPDDPRLLTDHAVAMAYAGKRKEAARVLLDLASRDLVTNAEAWAVLAVLDAANRSKHLARCRLMSTVPERACVTPARLAEGMRVAAADGKATNPGDE